VSDDDLLELMMDVDIVTPADSRKVDKMIGTVGGDVLDHYSKGGAAWGVLRLVGGGAGLDVATVAQDGTHAKEKYDPVIGQSVPPATFDHDLIADCERRDFTCNSVYYDVNNHVFVDPTGKGIADAQNKVLRLAPSKKERDKNQALGYRYLKFRMRGYTPDKETHKFCAKQLVDNVSKLNGHQMAKTLYRFFLAKGGDVDKNLKKVRKALSEEGLDSLWSLYVEPHLPEIKSYAQYKLAKGK